MMCDVKEIRQKTTQVGIDIWTPNKILKREVGFAHGRVLYARAPLYKS